MRLILKFTIFLTVCGVFVFIYIDQFVNTNKHGTKLAAGRLLAKYRNESQKQKLEMNKRQSIDFKEEILNVWCILSKVVVGYRYWNQINILLKSIFVHSRDVPIHLHLVCDANSKEVVRKLIDETLVQNVRKAYFGFSFYDLNEAIHNISDIVEVMTPFFSSRPGSYYADSLFYVSLGLHRIAPLKHDKAILLDCDLQFRTSVKELFNEFDKFSSTNLFGLSPELSLTYSYALYRYRKKHPRLIFGPELQEHRNMFPGFNSGVMLLRLDRIRKSIFYNNLLTNNVVKHLFTKYQLKSQLGGQDYLTILGYEYPELFFTMDCGWNRQLCTWWRIHGDVKEFDKHFKCDSHVKIYHGNCNSAIPK